MARIRSIHPGLLTDEAYMSLTVKQPLAIALYLGLLMESDDFGVFEWKPMTIKARVLPAVPTDVEVLLQVLVEHRFIAVFEVDGRKLGAIRNFCRYQRPKKPNANYPRNGAIEAWVRNGSGSEPVENHSPSGTENSPQMEDGGWRMEDGGDKDAAAAAREGSGRKPPSALEIECRRIVEPEPVMLAHDFEFIEILLADGITEEDIKTGIREAIEKRADPRQRFRSWARLAGWCRTAAQNRLAAAPRSKKPAREKPPDPNDPQVEMANGLRPTHSLIRSIWSSGRWLPDWGPRPGEPGCRISHELLAEIMAQAAA